MLALLADENLNRDILRGAMLREPAFDIVRVQDLGLDGADDPTVLDWAADNGRIVVTHDRATFPNYAYKRVETGDPMPGVFVVNDRMPVAQAIDELLII